MSRGLAIILVIALIGLGAYLVLNGDPHPSPLPQADSPPIGESQDSAPADLEPAELESTAIERVEHVPESLPEDRQGTYGQPDPDGVLVTVLDGTTSAPLPHAEVILIDMEQIDETVLEASFSQQPDIEALFVQFGVIYRCDEKGQTRLAEPSESILLGGRTKTHFGFDMSPQGEADSIELRINEVTVLEARVVDLDGRALEGVPIGLRIGDDNFRTDLLRNLSDEEGRVSLRLFPMLMQALQRGSSAIAVLGLLEGESSHPLDADDLPTEEVVLVLGDCGTVVIDLMDATGKPIQELAAVMLGPAGEGDFGAASGVMLTTRSGRLEFPAVGLGQVLRVEARTLKGHLSMEAEFAGPTRTGETITQALTLEQRAAVVRGRLVNEEGKPGPNLRLSSTLETTHGNGSSSSTRPIRTDEEGYFSMELKEEFKPGTERNLTLTFRATKRKPQRDVTIDLSREYPPGINDLGDVMITAPPTLASGLVLKPDGTPLRNADVLLEARHSFGEGMDAWYWSGVWDSRQTTGDDGRFTLTGRDPETTDYRLKVTHADFPDLIQDCLLGQTDMVLTMIDGGWVRGRVLVDEGIPMEGLQVAWLLESVEESHRQAPPSRTLDAQGVFELRGLDPGLTRLQVLFHPTQEVLHEFPLEVIARSGSAHDVGDIDLRGRLLSFTLRYKDEVGKPVREVKCIGSGFRHSTDEDKLSITTAEASMDLTLSAKGYQDVALLGVDRDQEVVFRNGLPVRLQLSNPGAIPDGCSLMVELEAVGADGASHSSSQSAAVDSEFEVRTTAPGAGTYRIKYHVRKSWRSGNSSSSVTIPLFQDPAAKQTIEVLDRAGEQYFTITPDPELLRQLNERLAEFGS